MGYQIFFWSFFGVLLACSVTVLWSRSRFDFRTCLAAVAAGWIPLMGAIFWVASGSGQDPIVGLTWIVAATAILALAVLPSLFTSASTDLTFRLGLAIAAPLIATLLSLRIGLIACDAFLGMSECVP